MKKIIRIDASALKNGSCMRALYWTVHSGYTMKISKIEIEFGSAVHLFLKTMYETKGNMGEALKKARDYLKEAKYSNPGIKAYLDELYLMKVCIQWWTWLEENDNFNVLLGADGKPAVEITFDNVVFEDDKCEIHFQGTVDRLGQFLRGCYGIPDFKTTSSREPELYFQSYEISTQLTFYIYNLLRYAKDNLDSIVAEVCKQQIGACIYAAFLNGKDSISFARSRIFYYKKDFLNLYERILMKKVFALVPYILEDAIPEPEGILTDTCSKPENASAAWKCRFFNVCAASDEIAGRHYLRNEFTQKEYLPLSHGKEEAKKES